MRNVRFRTCVVEFEQFQCSYAKVPILKELQGMLLAIEFACHEA
jgi:hypothetical protein